MSSASLSALYGAQPLCVWVEDEPTRVALTTAWAGDPVAIHVGGSNVTIRAVAEDAWRSGITHVFGVVDRDSGASNSGNWATPPNNLRTYVLQSPEIENLALDPKALAGCAYNTQGRSESDIAAKLSQIVQGMTWWMACCTVLARVREKRNEDFPPFPSSVEKAVDLTTALACIAGSGWFSTHVHALPGFADPNWLSNELQSEEARLSQAVAAGTWRDNFSGKQILTKVADFVYPNGVKGKNTLLLQAVIQHQVSNGLLAGELVALRSSLRRRVRLPP